jgi:hypothetical protein
MKKLVLLTCLTLMATFTTGLLASEVTTTITKASPTDWTVTYTAKSPVSRLAFRRSPDNSRTTRWTPLAENFTIRYQNGDEYIERLDGSTFTEVSFRLTPSYVALPKDYAPFSPFSDGGMLIHSGRFFTCPYECTSSMNNWTIEIIAPPGDHIIVQDEVYKGQASWTDKNDGMKVYVGHSRPVTDNYFISVIDDQLPPTLKTNLSIQLPLLMDLFANNFGELGHRPLMFASYSESQDGSYGNQGGTLPGQVFMHWYGQQSIEHLNSNAIYWFFAHEVAHLYQRDAGRIEAAQDAWIHEGAAELFAGLAAEPNYFKERLVSAEATCIAALDSAANYAEASLANFRIHYACGLVVMNAIHEDLRGDQSDVDLYQLWNLFNREVNAGSPATASTFVETVRPYLAVDIMLLLESISNPDINPVEFFKQLELEHLPSFS